MKFLKFQIFLKYLKRRITGQDREIEHSPRELNTDIRAYSHGHGEIARMERSTPVRKPHTSTADLLTWSEAPTSDSPATVSGARSHQVNALNAQVKN